MRVVMKTNTLILAGMLVAGAAMAGEPAATPSIQTAAAPTLGDWFVGGTYTNYEGDGELYALQIGRDLQSQFLGFDTAVYLEAGLYEESGLVDGENADLDVNPFTVNVKLERPLVGPLNFYVTGGIGFALWDLDVEFVGSEDGTCFYGQVTSGVLYNVCNNFEVFAGGRWSYLDERSDSQLGWEVGGRINF